tara:strand:+ start:573 stop:950 length:378 start_codon:yes stop_codon:yes gene_type:complete
MYKVSVQRNFIAQHYLIGGDWGDENKPHSHQYVLELVIKSEGLDKHGYLVDIVDIEAALDQTVSYFADRMLNETPEFKDLNPSLEHFCRIIWERIDKAIALPGKGELEIRLWENESCWASFVQAY